MRREVCKSMGSRWRENNINTFSPRVAQLVERSTVVVFIYRPVIGSIPISGIVYIFIWNIYARVPEWSKGTVSSSVAYASRVRISPRVF